MARGREQGWLLPLEREILPRSTRRPAASGAPLRTLADARAYLLRLGRGLSSRQHWQRAAALLFEAADRGDAGGATDQLELALFLDGLLWMPPPAKRRLYT